MKVFNSLDPTEKPSILMVVYGEGGVGKTTFAATAPRPIIADCENGSKYFGLRGIAADVALIEKWDDMQEFMQIALTDNYDMSRSTCSVRATVLRGGSRITSAT